eukprot:TRINITY_DN2250_c0_g1_i9.p2 TRINITY_DN2250_c0_g1~~TRINITY_DN2250_c0_g1_i9.p2  ORF type:complete len:106 (-),score=9.38 TRINITY_DN2250_c0_g1_i9:362-679(-)
MFYVLHPNMLFTMAYNMASVFLSQRTISKIKLCKHLRSVFFFLPGKNCSLFVNCSRSSEIPNPPTLYSVLFFFSFFFPPPHLLFHLVVIYKKRYRPTIYWTYMGV